MMPIMIDETTSEMDTNATSMAVTMLRMSETELIIAPTMSDQLTTLPSSPASRCMSL